MQQNDARASVLADVVHKGASVRAATFDYFKNRLIDSINRLIERLIEKISK